MKEFELTTCLVRNFQKKGVKSLVRTVETKGIRVHREIGTSSFIADICISVSKHNKNNKFKLIAIEVKVNDWENGLYQAWRYNTFAEKSYLAIYRPHSKKVDLKEFSKNNVGLIIFDEDSFEVVYHPRTNRFRKNTHEANVRDKIWGNCLSNVQSVCPA